MLRTRLFLFLGILLSSCSFAIAADVPSASQIEVIDDFSGGLNTQIDPTKLPNSYSPNAQNELIDEVPLSLVERNGFILSGTVPGLSKINFEAQFIKNGGAREMIVSDSSQVFTTKDFTNFTLIKPTLTATALIHSCQGRNKMLFVNGVDPDFFYDGINAISLDGNNGYPNVPIGKYCAFYHDRFWIFNTTGSNSALAFSALSSTDGFAIDSLTDVRAWPPTNQLNIGAGDGRDGTALDILKGQLIGHKRNGGIFTIYGTDEFTYFPRKSNAYIGTDSQDSIIQQDNLEYFHAIDGEYAFDGQNATRITDNIYPDMSAVMTNQSNAIVAQWDSQADFLFGGTFNQSTPNASGFLTMNTSTISFNTISPDSSTFTGAIHISTVSWPLPTTITSTESITAIFYADTNDSQVLPLTFILWTRNLNSCKIKIMLQNSNTGGTAFSDQFTGIVSNVSDFQQDTYYNFASSGTQFTASAADIAAGFVKYQITPGRRGIEPPSAECLAVGGGFDYFAPTTPFYADIKLAPSLKGQYNSAITTAASLTNWDLFNSKYNTNGGTVTFYVKAATSLATISTVTWSSITPGANISFAATNNFIQWASSFTINKRETPPTIDNVQVNYVTGGALDTRPLGMSWKGRYWLAVTTQTGGSSVIYVKSRITNKNPNAFVKFVGIPIKSMTRFGDNFYGGGASTGAIYRLDFGTNDNGTAINWFHETPDLNMADQDKKNNWFEKSLSELLIDSQVSNGATLNIGISKNGGDYTTQTVSLTGTGNILTSLKNLTTFGKYFRFRLSNSELDKPISFNGLGIIWNQNKVVR